MEKIIKEYIKKKYPEYSRCIEIKRIDKDGIYIFYSITYKPISESLFSKARERKNFRTSIWDLLEYLFQTKLNYL